MIFSIILLLIVLLLGYLYVRKCHKFWSHRGFPSTQPQHLIFGDIGDWVWGGQHFVMQYASIYRAFAAQKLVGFYEFHKPNLLVRDPQLVESILVKDFGCFTDRFWYTHQLPKDTLMKNVFLMKGKHWKALRSKLVSAFSTSKLKLMLPMMENCADILDTIIREKCEQEFLDIKEVSARFATDVIGCCIFGLQLNTMTESESELRNLTKSILKPGLKLALYNLMRVVVPDLALFLRLPEFPPQIPRFFNNLLTQCEQLRQTESFRRNDLLQSILDIRDHDRERIKIINGGLDDEIVDDVVVRSNMLIFYAAGLETTSSTISFCLYELALHPPIQMQLREEVQRIQKACEGNLNYEALKKMTYLEMVVSETLRKYPVGGLLFRVCTSACQLPGTSCTLMPSQRLIISIQGLHHDEKYYPDPDKFIPERFTPENIASRPPFTYLPFGDGPRICIAMRFAKMEVKLCLARLISKYEFLPCEKTDIPIQIEPRSSQYEPKNGIKLKVRSLI